MNFKCAVGLLGMLLFSLVGEAGPVISSFTPTFGSTNAFEPIITITGSGFGSGTSGGTLIVRFNGVRDLSAYATLTDGTEITAHVPPGATNGVNPILVAVLGSSSNYSSASFLVIGPGPYATGFSPTIGSTGTLVTISGVHFLPAADRSGSVTNVSFNGKLGTALFVSSDNELQVKAPIGVTSGPLTLLSSRGTSFNFTTTSNFFTTPVIKSFLPAFGRAGTNVVIQGTNFLGTTAVAFSGVAATSFTVDSNTQITATVPVNAVTGQIQITAPAGSVFSTTFTVQPTLSGFTPGFGPAGTAVTLTGANLNAGGLSVTFNGVTAAIGTTTFSSVAVTAPASTTGPIIVTTAGGAVTSSVSFYYPPTLTSFTPTNSLPGTTVKISGNNFTGATAVTFNGAAAASFVVSNNTTIGAVVPANVSTGPIGVTTPAGTANSAGLFYAAPVISGFNPSHGAPGTSVMISGNNFLGATAVQFNGSNAVFTVTNNGVIGAVVPNNATTGPLTVIAPGGTNTSAGTFTVDLTSDLSVFVTNAPDPVFVGSNLVYTITVANNVGPNNALNVKLTNTLPASVLLKSASTSQGTLNTNANPVTAALGTIPVGNSAIITLTVIPQTVGTITDIAGAGSDNADPNLANNSAANVTTVWPLAFLGIQSLTANQVKVFWPAPLSNFTLLTKSNLLPLNATWSTDLTARVISGTNISVTETNSGAAKFFRLKQ